MKRLLQFSLALCALLCGACGAAEPSACKSICSQEQHACRAQAAHLTDIESGTFLDTRDKNRDAGVMGKLQQSPQELKGREEREASSRKAERFHSCDDASMRCSRACSSPDAAQSEVLVKPAIKR